MPRRQGGAGAGRGFSLIELLVTITLLAAMVVALVTVMQSAQRSKTVTSNRIEAAQGVRTAIDMISRDLRAAGLGVDAHHPTLAQTPIAYVDSLQVLINCNLTPFPDTGSVPKPPQAYNPAGTPNPFPLDATAWQPPVKYRYGAEVIRWTLDLDNDGDVDSDDVIVAPDGTDAELTPNPNDFVLLREVYGDSVANVAGSNQDASMRERVALVRRPGNDIPPIFQVYMRGSSTPWDWSLGPVPPDRLGDIERLEVQITGTSGRGDWRGDFAESKLKTEAHAMRNTTEPIYGVYSIDGIVFVDLDKDEQKDFLELGLPSVTMTLSNGMSKVTDLGGYFQFRVPAGTYVLKQQPIVGYGTLTDPDSFVVTVPPPVTITFADTVTLGP